MRSHEVMREVTTLRGCEDFVRDRSLYSVCSVILSQQKEHRMVVLL